MMFSGQFGSPTGVPGVGGDHMGAMMQGDYHNLFSEFAAMQMEAAQTVNACKALQREHQSLRDNYEEVRAARCVQADGAGTRAAVAGRALVQL
jgi:hypothetical protein